MYAIDLAELTRDHLIGLAPFIVGLLVVALLIGAVWLGRRIRAREPRPSREPQQRSGAWQRRHESDDEARAHDHGPGHQDSERHELAEGREPDEVPRDGRRRLPYEIDTKGNRRADDQERPTWEEGSSGSFGSG
jgi:hypothetical protein